MGCRMYAGARGIEMALHVEGMTVRFPVECACCTQNDAIEAIRGFGKYTKLIVINPDSAKWEMHGGQGLVCLDAFGLKWLRRVKQPVSP